jgi:hypothetical protein
MIEAPGQDYLSYLYNPDPEHNGPVATDYKFTEELQ